MKKIILVFAISLIATSLFSYSIKKDYDGSFEWDYEILATNESSSYIDDDGTEKYYDTVLIRDSKSKINYIFYCSDENACLTKYYELTNKYKNRFDIRDKLIPDLQPLVSSFSTSKDGTWMFCCLSEFVENDYSNISDDDFYKLFMEKYYSDFFDKDDLLYFALTLFDTPEEFYASFNSELETEEDRMDYLEVWIIPLLETLRTDTNTKKIEDLKTEFMDLLQIDPVKFEEYIKENE